MADTKQGYKTSRIQVVTPKGVARFPSVHTPDSYKGGPESFKASIVFDADEDLSALEQAALKIAAEAWPKLKADKVNVLIKDGDDMEKDGEPIAELAGKRLLTAKCSAKHPPKIVGPDKRDLPVGTEVRGRDEIKLVVQPIASDVPVKGTVTFRLLAVQLVTKNGGSGNFADLFDEEGEGLGSTTPDSEPSSGLDAGSPSDDELPF